MDFDLIILDIMMPGLNGYQTCIEIRKNSNAPILFLSARTKDSDKTLGFSSGGDDYLAKPFSYNELINRSKALIRRYQVYRGKDAAAPALAKEPLIFHHLKIDEEKETVSFEDTPLMLTDTEYAMLLVLVKRRHQIFSAQHLYESVWNSSLSGLTVGNTTKDGDFHMDSNNIGLKNVDKMIQILDGRMDIRQKMQQFEVELWFPLQ